jgi:catechol 2,3-dioxygenase-like lactoylglutathione lyase family enzyme
MVGINHVALEVSNLDDAIRFYGRIFDLAAVEHEENMAFISMGDQFLALVETEQVSPQRERHFGLVVDDKERVRRLLQQEDVTLTAGRRLNFRDPWGNHIQVVDYRDVQFSKVPSVLKAMGLTGEKRQSTLEELRVHRLI